MKHRIVHALRVARRFLLGKPTSYRSVCRSKNDYRKRLNMTLEDWFIHHEQNVVSRQCRWMGVPAWKNPMDAWVYQEIIHEVRPDVVIEIGSKEGGSTLYLANLLDLMGHGTLISIDIDRSRYHVKHDRIIALTGDSASEEIVKEVHDLCSGKSVLVIHDGDHTRGQVYKDLEAYQDLVSINSYFIVEDGYMDLFEAGHALGSELDGPLAATEEFTAKYTSFVPDPDRERYVLTNDPKGFLKRVR